MAHGIIIHGGAGTWPRDDSTKFDRMKRLLTEAIAVGVRVLEEKGSALDTVERAVAHLESSGVFNAGLGACLTIDKRIEMDAGIMDGKSLRAGAVGCVRNVANPVRLARRVMELTPHLLLAGPGAESFAKECGLWAGELPISEDKLQRFDKELEKRRTAGGQGQHGTVGAVALDQHGSLAAAVSTGGLWLKRPGRVGDSAIVGAGFYADANSAAVATGSGEEMMRLILSKLACDLMGRGLGAKTACDEAIRVLTERAGKGTGGTIAMDRRGELGFSFNTDAMPVAYYVDGMKEPVVDPPGAHIADSTHGVLDLSAEDVNRTARKRK